MILYIEECALQSTFTSTYGSLNKVCTLWQDNSQHQSKLEKILKYYYKYYTMKQDNS